MPYKFGPSFSRPAISRLANASKKIGPSISCLAILMVRHFHVLHFQSTDLQYVA